MEKRYLSPKELSEYLGVSINTIYGWVSQKKIPYKKLGRLVRFSVEEIDEWVKQNSVATYDI
ncbi:MAG: helix-turn-helix domain-containing protein [Candidatus Omnitrophota bacterium]|nr:helix-turn-helix domain-containing protein [Candidatus Omnitrophota bacterium]